MILRISLLLSLFLILDFLSAQPHLFPLNNEYNEVVLKSSVDTSFNSHQSLKPFREDEMLFLSDRLTDLNIEGKSKALNYLFNSSSRTSAKDNIELTLSPIIHAMMMTGTSNDSTDNARWLGIGFQARMHISDKVALGADYTYSQMKFPNYVEEFSRDRGIAPGFGSIDTVTGINTYYTLYLNYSPTENISFEVGRGKQFIGHGYRSLLLSDNAMAYPYAKILINIWKIKYQVLYSNYKHIVGNEFNPDSYLNKYSTSNYLSMNFGRNLSVGLFQSVIWQAMNGDHERGFDVNYLNPIVFMRPIEFSVGSPDNVIMGLDLSYSFYKKRFKVYSQVVLDEFLLSEIKDGNGWWANKYGFQFGLKANDLAGVKGLSLRLEHNQIRPYTYSHGTEVQNYGHYNESLAHTLQANFYEYIAHISYTKKRYLFSLHVVHAQQGLDDIGKNYGVDIYKPNQSRESAYGNYIGQGLSSDLSYQQIKAAYLINPDWKLMFEIGLTSRQRFTETRDAEFNTMIHIGFKTALYNQYLDF